MQAKQRINKNVKKGPIKVVAPKIDNMVNSIMVKGNGYQKPLSQGRTITKFVDLAQVGVSISSIGAILPGICPITQGIGASQRTGDTVFWRNIYINYTLVTQNADVFSTARIILFQWHPNSTIIAPTVQDVLQTANNLSMYDWQFSNQFAILYDRVHIQSGTASVPADSGNQGYFGSINFSKGTALKALYSPGVITGSEQFYLLVISDSLIAPFPTFNAITRVVYSNE